MDIKIFNKKPQIFILFSTLIAVVLFVGVTYFTNQSQPPDPQSKATKNFIIRKGEGVSAIADELQKEGLIKNSLIFKVIVKLENLGQKIQAGSFHLSPAMDAKTLAKNLTTGTFDIWVTIPEGLRKEEIAQKIIEADIKIDKEAFISQAKEGYLFPDTYLIPKYYTTQDIIKLMDDNFQKKIKKPSALPGISFDQAIILASIVEREAMHQVDRPLIAGILLKRLKNDWPLETDAAVQYALGFDEMTKTWWKKNLTADDLKIDSSYNTRKYPGLPPTPICNPGQAAIEAVFAPENSPYWFYLSDKEGNMHYAKTLEDHNKNVSLYLK